MVANRVLLVDDDGPILRALQARLQHAGYEVDVAREGTTALGKSESNPPDFAVLDINMPGLDGFAVAKRLSQVAPACQLLFLTANKDSAMRQAAESMDAGFMEKPFDSRRILEVIDGALS